MKLFKKYKSSGFLVGYTVIMKICHITTSGFGNIPRYSSQTSLPHTEIALCNWRNTLIPVKKLVYPTPSSKTNPIWERVVWFKLDDNVDL